MNNTAPGSPLVNRGAEALEALLNSDQAKAIESLRLLTYSELDDLAEAAYSLGSWARAVGKR